MAISTTADLNNIYNQIFEDSLFVLREQNMMTQLVKNYRGRGYAPRKIGLFSTTTAVTVPEGVDFSNATTLSKSLAATLTPGKSMGQYILTDESVETDDIDDIVEAARKELGEAIAVKIDKDILSLFASFTTSKGAANSDLTKSNVAAAITELVAANAYGEMHVVLHPYQWHDIWVSLNSPAANYAFLGEVANEAIRKTFVSDWLGATWHQTGNITIDANNDAIGAVFVEDAMAIDVRKQYTIEIERDASKQATEYNAVVGYGFGIIRNALGVKLIGDATAPT